MELVPDIQLKEENNKVILVGEVIEKYKKSHETFNELFYSFKISVKRLSGDTDELEIVISEKILDEDILSVGNMVIIEGEIRSYNYIIENEEKRKLILSVFAKDIKKVTDEDLTTNEVTLVGYVCKKPIYRKTPFGREIADILLAVNRVYGKSDYLPCIAWGRNAKFAENNLEVGDKAKIVGRFQSREYVKKNGEKEEKKVAYEISLSSIEKIKEEVEIEVEVEVKE